MEVMGFCYVVTVVRAESVCHPNMESRTGALRDQSCCATRRNTIDSAMITNAATTYSPNYVAPSKIKKRYQRDGVVIEYISRPPDGGDLDHAHFAGNQPS